MKLRRRVLSALLSLAMVAIPMTMGAFGASADSPNISESLTVVSGHKYYVKVNNQYLGLGDYDRDNDVYPVKMVNDITKANAFTMSFISGKGYQFVSGSYALTAPSRTQNTEIRMETNTKADNQWWNAYEFTSHYLLTASDDVMWQIGFDGDKVVLKYGLTGLNWQFVEASTSDSLQMGVYTIYNQKTGLYLSHDTTPAGKAILTRAAGNNSRWMVFPQNDGTYMICLQGGGTWANLNFLYPDSTWVTMGESPVNNRIIHVQGDTYRIISSVSSFGVLGCCTNSSTGELYPGGIIVNSLHNDYSGDWTFTYVGPVTGTL